MVDRARREDLDADAFYVGKVRTGDFFFERMLPRTRTLAATIRAGAGSLMDIPADAFAH
jgi:hypothetical protein